MRTKIFFFTMLISIAASAQRTTPVTIANTKVDYSTKIVTFDLSWKGSDANHRDEVWVFVDIQPVTGANTLGNWSPATLVPSSTTVTAGNGNQYSSLTRTVVSGNTRGVWIKGTSSVTTNTFNATIKITLASATPAKFNACAYATDYPPNASSYNNGTYTFNGTKPFIINGTSVNNNQYSVAKITSLTDATGCPGGIGRDVIHNDGACLPHLTSIGSYCRDIVADDASTYTGCGVEIKRTNQGTLTSYGGANYLCPSGWRYPDATEGLCMSTNWEKIELIAGGDYKWEFVIQGSNSTYVTGCYIKHKIGCWGINVARWSEWPAHGGFLQVRCVRN
jgi:archaellum component FlaF (FlaF/FlaG flagellin family)